MEDVIETQDRPYKDLSLGDLYERIVSVGHTAGKTTGVQSARITAENELRRMAGRLFNENDDDRAVFVRDQVIPAVSQILKGLEETLSEDYAMFQREYRRKLFQEIDLRDEENQ